MNRIKIKNPRKYRELKREKMDNKTIKSGAIKDLVFFSTFQKSPICVSV